MKTIIAAITIITTILITATDTEASHKPDGKWQHEMSVDEFDDTQEHRVWHITKVDGFEMFIYASCVAGTFGRFQFHSPERLDDRDTMRVRIDNLPAETITITKSSTGDYDWISMLSDADIETITSGMLTAKKVRFEIFKKPLTPLVVSPNLEGFREAWEHVKPHCYPAEQSE